MQLNYGLGLYWRGDDAGAKAAWRRRSARSPTRRTPSAPRTCSTRTSRAACRRSCRASRRPPGCRRLSPPAQLALLERNARDRDEGARLLYGVALQRLGRQVSALREFEAAAALAPSDPEAQVAAAVGRFDKADPSKTFSRLGPLARRYPKSQSVRFHLGLCLLWLGSVKQAKAGAPARARARAADAARGRVGRVPRPPQRDRRLTAEDRSFGPWRSSAASGTVPPSWRGV